MTGARTARRGTTTDGLRLVRGDACMLSTSSGVRSAYGRAQQQPMQGKVHCGCDTPTTLSFRVARGLGALADQPQQVLCRIEHAVGPLAAHEAPRLGPVVLDGASARAQLRMASAPPHFSQK